MNTTYDQTTGPSPEADSRKPIWIRGAFMIFFMIAFSIAQTLLAATAVVQWLSLILTREANTFLGDFGRSLGLWLGQTARFQSGVSEEKPFPFAPWPKPE